VKKALAKRSEARFASRKENEITGSREELTSKKWARPED
jgi:hypothetical protein